MRRRALLAAVLLGGSAAQAHAHGQVGALSTDCAASRPDPATGSLQFVATCAAHARSPDGRFAVVQKAYRDEQPTIELRDRDDHVLDQLAGLSDDMPLVVSWAPDSRRFFVNHYVGSGMDRLQLFQVVNRQAVETSSVVADAIRTAVRRYPCLGRGAQVHVSGLRWSRDGGRIAMIAYARADACLGAGNRASGRWEPLWMIGDAASGRIDPTSVRVRRGGVGPIPRGGLWTRRGTRLGT